MGEDDQSIWKDLSVDNEKMLKIRSRWQMCDPLERACFVEEVWQEQVELDMMEQMCAPVYLDAPLSRLPSGFSAIPYLLGCASSFDERRFIIQELWAIARWSGLPELFIRIVWKLATNDTERTDSMMCLWACVEYSDNEKTQLLKWLWQHEWSTEERLDIAKCIFDCSLYHEFRCDIVEFICCSQVDLETREQVGTYLCQYAWNSQERQTCIGLLWKLLHNQNFSYYGRLSIFWLAETLWNIACTNTHGLALVTEIEKVIKCLWQNATDSFPFWLPYNFRRWRGESIGAMSTGYFPGHFKRYSPSYGYISEQERTLTKAILQSAMDSNQMLHALRFLYKSCIVDQFRIIGNAGLEISTDDRVQHLVEAEFVELLLQCTRNSAGQARVIEGIWEYTADSTEDRMRHVTYIWESASTPSDRSQFMRCMWECAKTSTEQAQLVRCVLECAETSIEQAQLVRCMWECAKTSIEQAQLARWVWQCAKTSAEQVNLFNCLWACESQSAFEEEGASTSHVLEMVESQCSRAMKGLAMTRTSHATKTRVLTYIGILREVLSWVINATEPSPTLNMFPIDQRHHYQFILGLSEELFNEENRRQLYETLHQWAKASCEQVRQRRKKLEELFLQFTELRKNLSSSLSAEEVSTLDELGESLKTLVDKSRAYAHRFEANVDNLFKGIFHKLLPAYDQSLELSEPDAFEQIEESQKKASEQLKDLTNKLSSSPPGKLIGLDEVAGCHETAVVKVEELRATRVNVESNTAPRSQRPSKLGKVANEVKRWCGKTYRSFVRHREGLLQLLHSTPSKDMEWLTAHYPEQVMRSLRLTKFDDHRDTIQLHATIQILYDHWNAWSNYLEETIRKQGHVV